MSRFGIFDTEASDTDFTAKLYEEIIHFSWFPPEVCLPHSLHLRESIKSCLSLDAVQDVSSLGIMTFTN